MDMLPYITWCVRKSTIESQKRAAICRAERITISAIAETADIVS